MSKPAPLLPARLKPSSSQAAEHRHPARREEDGNPAVRDLGRHRHVLRADGGDVDRHVGARVENRLQRLAEPRGVRPGVRDLVVLAVILHRLLPLENRPHDVDVLAGLLERLAERLTVPAFDDLWSRHAEAEPEAAARQRIQRHRGHGRHGGRAAGDLHDRGADVDLARLRGDPRRRHDGIRAVRFGGPDGVVSELLRFPQALGVDGELLAGVAEVNRQLHCYVPHARWSSTRNRDRPARTRRRPSRRATVAAPSQPKRARSTRPRRSTTPSRSSSMRCVSMLAARLRRLIRPSALITRCHGTPGGQRRIAPPTARAARGRPSRAATCPYDATEPRLIRRTRA